MRVAERIRPEIVHAKYWVGLNVASGTYSNDRAGLIHVPGRLPMRHPFHYRPVLRGWLNSGGVKWADELPGQGETVSDNCRQNVSGPKREEDRRRHAADCHQRDRTPGKETNEHEDGYSEAKERATGKAHQESDSPGASGGRGDNKNREAACHYRSVRTRTAWPEPENQSNGYRYRHQKIAAKRIWLAESAVGAEERSDPETIWPTT